MNVYVICGASYGFDIDGFGVFTDKALAEAAMKASDPKGEVGWSITEMPFIDKTLQGLTEADIQELAETLT